MLVAAWQPALLHGVDLGDSVISARRNMAVVTAVPWQVVQADLMSYQSDGFDVVYCIGVLHHLADPAGGFQAVLRNTAPGGRLHCWVYAREGNGVVRWLVDPLRRVVSRLPWRVTKYGAALPLAVLLFAAAKLCGALPAGRWVDRLPMAPYLRWISRSSFRFHFHVAFDQLVTPRTRYIRREEIESWLHSASEQLVPGSVYIMMRNGNSWKFGGRRRTVSG